MSEREVFTWPGHEVSVISLPERMHMTGDLLWIAGWFVVLVLTDHLERWIVKWLG